MACPNIDQRFHDIHNCSFCRVDRLTEQLIEANKKWQTYEQEYILPVFNLMEEVGYDLRELVKKNPGQNCVILAVKTLINELKTNEVL